MNKIMGKCPVCGQGNIVEREKSYSCDFFKSMDEKCTFAIWKEQSGKHITEEIAMEIIEKGQTRTYHDFISREQKRFSASLAINENGRVVLSFDNFLPEMECPKCGGRIMETKKSYLCEKYIGQECGLYVPKVLAGKEIDTAILTDLLKKGSTGFLSGFMRNDGQTFDAKLVLDATEMKVSFDTTLATCPKCKTGGIREWDKNYSCSNYRSESPCNFTIWKQQYGGEVSRADAIDLCTKGRTKAIAFRTKGKNHPYSGRLRLTEEGTVAMEKV